MIKIKQKQKKSRLFLFSFFLAPALIMGGFLFLQKKIVFAAQKVEINAEELISLTNQTRKEYGLPVLKKNEKLTQAAQSKAEDMLNNNYFAHTSPSGKTPWFWIEKEKYDYMYAGENLALGFLSSTAVHQAWLNSPDHRDNILGCHYEDIGIAVVLGEFKNSTTVIAVQMFGAVDNKYQNCEENTALPLKQKRETKPLPPPDSTPPPAPQFLKPAANLITNQTAFSFQLKSEAFSQIILYQNEKEVYQGKANNKGEVQWRVSGFKDGEYFFQARSKDQAGNLSAFSQPLKIIIDTKPPQINPSSSFVALAPGDPLNKFLVKIQTQDQDAVKAVVFSSDKIYETQKTKQGFEAIIPQTNDLLLASVQDQAGNVTDFQLNFLNSASISKKQAKVSPFSFKQIVLGIVKIYEFTAILGTAILFIIVLGSLIIKLTLKHPREAVLGVWILSLFSKIKK